MKNIAFGLEMLGRILNESFNVQYNELLQGEKDVGRIRKDILEYRHVMKDFLRRIRVGAREEIIDGEVKEITYDTTMTPKEVIDILYQYEKTLERLQFERLNNYIGLGLGLYK